MGNREFAFTFILVVNLHTCLYVGSDGTHDIADLFKTREKIVEEPFTDETLILLHSTDKSNKTAGFF